MLRKSLVITLLFAANLAPAQQRQRDSLRRELQTAGTDTDRIRYSYELSQLFPDQADSALRYIAGGARLAASTGNAYYIAYGKYWFGKSYLLQDNYPLAIKNEFEALRMSTELHVPALTMQAYKGLAAIYDDQNDDKKAVYYIRLAIPIAQALGDRKSLAGLYNYISYFHNRVGQFDEALGYDNLAKKLTEPLHDNELSAQAYMSIGKTYLSLKKPDLGLMFLHKAIGLLAGQPDSTRHLFNCFTFIAGYYVTSGPRDSAIFYSQKELAAAKIMGYKAGILDANKNLGASYQAVDPGRSAQYYKEALALNEQLFDAQKTRAFQNMIVADEQQRREEAEQKAIAEEERKENLQLIGIAFFIPVFVVSVFFLSRTKLHRSVIDFMGVLSLLLAFEFITLLAHPFIERLTRHTPVLELLILVVIASVLVPLHHSLTKWLKDKLSYRGKKSRSQPKEQAHHPTT